MVCCGMFDAYLSRWKLIPDGSPIITTNARLLPVRYGGEPAMLKLAIAEEERAGHMLMEWWDGDGAARVLARADEAVLMERAKGTATLADMAYAGQDDEACRKLCAVAARLHAPRAKPIVGLVPLSRWFRELEPAAASHGGILARCAESARTLLTEPREVVVLHGDLHHGNVLDFGVRGWLAIDPKGLVGERGFDFANTFTNTSFYDDPTRPLATRSGRFLRRLEVVAECRQSSNGNVCYTGSSAWTGLSAAWFLGDGDPAAINLQIAELAAAELNR